MRYPAYERKDVPLDLDAAESLAVAALGHIASDPELLPRFLALTGIEAEGIRLAAREPGFLAGVLQFLAAHEPSLMAFAEATHTPPERISRAIRVLDPNGCGPLSA